MFENNLSSIDHVSIYPVISVIAFFLFFIGITVWALTAKKDFLHTMSHLPLEDNLINPDSSKENKINSND